VRDTAPVTRTAVLPAPSPLLAAAGPEAAGALRAQGAVRVYRRGEALMHAGQVPQDVFVLLAGRVKVSTSTAAGRELLLAFREPGDLVGELSALDEQPRSATVVALEPVEALVVAHAAFRAWLAAHPPAAHALLRLLAARLRDADAKRVQLAGYDALGRVAFCLLELSSRFGSAEAEGTEILLPISQDELAGWAGASLESVGRALATMRRLGWIETRRRRIRVLDAPALERATR
jgi:CRP/FNR family transcriptional regulator, cyclic AMP receptor protein